MPTRTLREPTDAALEALLLTACQCEVVLDNVAGLLNGRARQALTEAFKAIHPGGSLDDAKQKLVAVLELTHAKLIERPTSTLPVGNGRAFAAQMGSLFRRLREFRGLPRGDLAQACGITEETLSLIEAGKSFSAANARDKVSEALGYDLSELVHVMNLEDVDTEDDEVAIDVIEQERWVLLEKPEEELSL